MSKELIIDVTACDISIALLENKKLVELNKDKSNLKFSVGDIYLGKIKKLMPGLNAAFVDIGSEKDAFLHYHDLGPQFRTLHKYLNSVYKKKGKVSSLQKIRREPDINKNGKISEVLKQGQLILVQIAKEPISTKGPRLTSEISIPGRNVVLIPLSDKVSISQKIDSVEEKNRLRRLLNSIRPNNYGIIVRTVAEGKKVKDFDTEIRNLLKKWESAFENIKGVQTPYLVLSELNRTSAILRDMLNMSFNNIHVNDENVYRELKDYIRTIAPEKEKIVKLYKNKTPIFEHFGIEKQIKSSFGKTVSFKNGAYLIIEHTEALHVIDVNSGNRAKKIPNQEDNAVEVNLTAADEIARQLRLRDMGGIIVVDFIDMHKLENKQKVNEKLRQAMAEDRAKHTILPLSKFGLMQITRQRVRPEMNISINEKCPSCQGTGEISPSVLFIDKIENFIYSITKLNKYSKLILKVHPYISAYLTKGFWSIKRQWRFRFKSRIVVEPVFSYNFLEFHLFNKDGEEIVL